MSAAPTGTEGQRFTIVHYDPDANYLAIPRIMATLEEYLAATVGQVKVVGASDAQGMQGTVEQTGAQYAIVPESVREAKATLNLNPLVRPERGGEGTYRKVLVARRGVDLEQLRSSRIATADIGARGAGRARFLSSLAQGGINIEGMEVLALSKDIDALFALTVGQADAALVTRGSVSLLRELDPTTASSLTELWTSPPRPFPVLCAVSDGGGSEARASMVRAFTEMHQTAKGKAVLDLASYDRWIAVGGGP